MSNGVTITCTARYRVLGSRSRIVRGVDEVFVLSVVILADTTMLIDEVVGRVQSSAHEGPFEEEPFE